MIRKRIAPPRRTLLAICALSSALAVTGESLSPAASIWREGEDADAAEVQDHGWYNSVRSELLSGGDWLSNFGSDEGTATYHLTVTEPGSYAVWLRANPTGAKLSWRVDDRPWQQAPLKKADYQINVAEGGAVDIRHVAWVRLAKLELTEGQHALHLKMHSANRNHGAVDAIFLNNEGLVPVGKGNPAIEGEQREEGYFAWSPGLDPLTGESPIDLRHLNEATAGETGFVQRDGDRFTLNNGNTVRFWTVQGGLGNDSTEYDRRARRLAKYGVNLVRMGGGNFFRDWRNDRSAFRNALDDFHRKVAALKKHGIYTYIDHLYWHTHHEIDESVFPGFGEGKNAIALMFFSDRFQQLYKRFLSDLMTAENPHTGSSMAQDPAVAFLEIQNESSLLFYTFKPAQFPEPERQLVERKFGDWLKAKYGSLEKARSVWKTNPRRGDPTADQFAAGRVGLYPAAKLTGEDWAENQRNSVRASDQLQFMVESQKSFYEMMRRYLNQKVGMGQLIAASNWKTADPRVLDGLERYTYTGADVVCRNSYYGVDYKAGGQQRFYAIEAGDTFRYASAIKAPNVPSPLGTPLIAGYPFMVTENNWTRPNRFRAEWPLLVATYGRMSGADGWTFFAKGDTDWRHSMGVWDLSNPSVLGQFPAAALMFRRGDVNSPDQPAVYEHVSLDDAFAMNGTQMVPLRGADALWKSRLGEREGPDERQRSRIDPLAFFVGPVLQEFGSGPSDVESVDLNAYTDVPGQTVRSLTGELNWNAGTGYMTVDTPRAQGVWGFLSGAGRVELGDMTVQSNNEYGAVIAVSLDSKPLSESGKILIQTATWDHPYGFETEAVGQYERIVNLGGYPLNVRNVDAAVELDREIDEATVLDGNGYVTSRRARSQSENGRTRIQLPSDSIYTIVGIR